MQPAQAAIGDIEAALATSGTAPVQYIPGRVSDVRNDLDALKRSFEQADYARVLRDAPAVLESARSLQQAAATREAALLQSLQQAWASLELTLPADIEAVRSRLQRLATVGLRPDGTPSDAVTGAARRLDDAQALWERARAERNAQHLAEAVALASQARELLDRLAGEPALGAARGQVK